MNPSKRRSLVTLASGVGLVLAHAHWPAMAEGRATTSLDERVRAHCGDRWSLDADHIQLAWPDDVENAALVPVQVQSDRANIDRVLILRDAHQQALVMEADLGQVAQAHLEVQLRLERPCRLAVMMRDDQGQWFRRDLEVRSVATHCLECLPTEEQP